MEATETVIVDTGVLVAALDSNEQAHDWVLQTIGSMNSPMLTSHAVVSETCFLVGLRRHVVRRLAAWFAKGGISLAPLDAPDVRRAFELMGTYANVPMSFADACLVCIAEANPGACIFTLDPDFQIYRQRNRRVIPLIAPFV